jgi:hypothetical protein
LFRSAGLDLNFAGGVFSLNNTRTSNPANIPGWSFSRTDTNGTATALDLAGNVIQFATGVPRITNRGILVEEARTNLLERSTEFDNAYWSKARCTVSADTTVAPDGTTTADSLVEDTTSNSHPVFRTVGSLANATAYTWSVFVAPLGRTSCNLAASNTAFGSPGNATFSLSGAGSVSASSGCTAVIQAVAGGFYRCSITLTTVSAGNGDVYVQPFNGGTSYLGNGAAALAIWGAQLELGAFATSPIITTGAAGTRGADRALVGSLVPFLSGLTMLADVEILSSANPINNYVVALSDGTTNNRISLFKNLSSASLTSRLVTATVAASPGASAAAFNVGVNKAGITAAAGRAICSLNGALTTASAPTALPAYSQLSIGTQESAVAGFELNGYIRRVQVLPYAATDAQLQALTAP